ncbi:MAG: TlpA disulfide reductase family protein [Bacteroidia bacterium]
MILIWVSLPISAFSQQKAPDFTITTTGQEQFHLYTNIVAGKVVLLDFFFADCVPCQSLSPMVDELYRDYGSGSGRVRVIGISDRDDNLRLKTFDSTYNITYPSAGEEGGADTITALYQAEFSFLGWPTYAVVCSDTGIVWNIRPLTNGIPEIRKVIDSCLIVSGVKNQVTPSLAVFFHDGQVIIRSEKILEISAGDIYNMQGQHLLRSHPATGTEFFIPVPPRMEKEIIILIIQGPQINFRKKILIR